MSIRIRREGEDERKQEGEEDSRVKRKKGEKGEETRAIRKVGEEDEVILDGVEEVTRDE